MLSLFFCPLGAVCARYLPETEAPVSNLHQQYYLKFQHLALGVLLFRHPRGNPAYDSILTRETLDLPFFHGCFSVFQRVNTLPSERTFFVDTPNILQMPSACVDLRFTFFCVPHLFLLLEHFLFAFCGYAKERVVFLFKPAVNFAFGLRTKSGHNNTIRSRWTQQRHSKRCPIRAPSLVSMNSCATRCWRVQPGRRITSTP